MNTIELNAVRMGILDIAVGFDEKFRLSIYFDFGFFKCYYNYRSKRR